MNINQNDYIFLMNLAKKWFTIPKYCKIYKELFNMELALIKGYELGFKPLQSVNAFFPAGTDDQGNYNFGLYAWGYAVLLSNAGYRIDFYSKECNEMQAKGALINIKTGEILGEYIITFKEVQELGIHWDRKRNKIKYNWEKNRPAMLKKQLILKSGRDKFKYLEQGTLLEDEQDSIHYIETQKEQIEYKNQSDKPSKKEKKDHDKLIPNYIKTLYEDIEKYHPHLTLEEVQKQVNEFTGKKIEDLTEVAAKSLRSKLAQIYKIRIEKANEDKSITYNKKLMGFISNSEDHDLNSVINDFVKKVIPLDQVDFYLQKRGILDFFDKNGVITLDIHEMSQMNDYFNNELEIKNICQKHKLPLPNLDFDLQLAESKLKELRKIFCKNKVA